MRPVLVELAGDERMETHMRILLTGAVTAAAFFAAVPAFAQNYGPQGYGAQGPYYDNGPGYSRGYDYNDQPGGDYTDRPRYYGGYGQGYAAPAPTYEGRSVEVGPDPSSQSAVGYCEQRFRSYDPASGTYVGFDGMRHPCP